MKHDKSQIIARTAFMSALMAITAQIAVPLPSGIPFTLQTFAVALSGYILGMKYGTASVAVYLTIGAAGVPVFSHLRGGFFVLVGSPAGGFLIGFLFLSFFCGLGKHLLFRSKGNLYLIVSSFFGVILCHLCGVILFSSLYQISFIKGFISSSLPFLLKDFVSVFLAYILSVKIGKFTTK